LADIPLLHLQKGTETGWQRLLHLLNDWEGKLADKSGSSWSRLRWPLVRWALVAHGGLGLL